MIKRHQYVNVKWVSRRIAFADFSLSETRNNVLSDKGLVWLACGGTGRHNPLLQTDSNAG